MNIWDMNVQKDGKLLLRTLGDMQKILPPEIFVRIHHSTVVNLNAISNYSRTDGGYVVMNTRRKTGCFQSRKRCFARKAWTKKRLIALMHQQVILQVILKNA